MVTNGRIPLTSLTTVDGVPLLNSAAAGYRVWKHIAKLEGDTIAVARPLYGSGYRDIATQIVYYNASRGDRAALAKVGLNANLLTSIGAPGGSSHGWGNRLDVTWNGHTKPTGDQLELAARYGWHREFGSADENHMEFDNKSHAPTEADKNRIVCHYLNERHLGKKSTTEDDGLWPAESIMSWLLQTAGHADGLYPTPQYKIDGIAGNHTKWLRNYYWTKLWAS